MHNLAITGANTAHFSINQTIYHHNNWVIVSFTIGLIMIIIILFITLCLSTPNSAGIVCRIRETSDPRKAIAHVASCSKDHRSQTGQNKRTILFQHTEANKRYCLMLSCWWTGCVVTTGLICPPSRPATCFSQSNCNEYFSFICAVSWQIEVKCRLKQQTKQSPC